MVKCSFCESNSVYFNPVKCKEYCIKHFCDYFEDSISNNLKKLKIDNPRIMLYYSGGKDSAVLLYVLKNLNYDVSVITADISLNDTFKKISSLGKKECDKLNIKYYKAKFDDFINVNMSQIIKLYGSNMACNYCGELRNIVMDIASKNLGVDAVASGHNLDDITRFLHNNYLKNDIFRIVEFASKIYPSQNIKKYINYDYPVQIKPLAYLTEKEICLYCFINKIEFVDACCGFTNPKNNNTQGWRTDLTYAINFLEEKYPFYSLKLIENFEKNILPIFEKCAIIDKDFYLKRQCVFCKEEMNTTEKNICLLCKQCAKKFNLKINHNATAKLINNKNV